MNLFIKILLLQMLLIAQNAMFAKDLSKKTNALSLKVLNMPNLKTNKLAKEMLFKHIQMQFGLRQNKKSKGVKKAISSKISSNILNDSKNICEVLLINALKDLQDQALNFKASKITNIITNELNPKSSKTYTCDIGKVFSKVTLKADIVK